MKTTYINGVGFANLTPHEIKLFTEKREIIFPTSGIVLRIDTGQVDHTLIFDEILIKQNIYHGLNYIPEKKKNFFYIVSLPILMAMKGKRKDFISPDTDKGCVRDKDGRIIGTKNFIVL